jgi:asparaginyl-tRNA synthetase
VAWVVGSRLSVISMLEQSSIAVDSSALIEEMGSEQRQAIMKIQTAVISSMTRRLSEDDFRWILPVILAKTTDPLWPDPGASIEKRIEIEIYGHRVRTMQSMIIHKRILASLGPEKFFSLSPNIRIETRERAKTGRHLYEFTQLEIEMANGKMEDVFGVFEDLIKSSVAEVKKKLHDSLETLRTDLRVPETPFKVYSRRKLEEEYGKNWETSISEKSINPVWVTDIPREFYDYEDETTAEWRNFDLILPEGYGEVISGAEREYEYTKLLRKMDRDGLNRDDYGLLLKLAREGRLKPSAGAGLGIERFISYLSGTDHVAEVQPFPRIPGTVPEL